jgi:uncharacterized membrane protein YfhO
MDITDLNIGVIYTNTMQTIIDIINDIVMFFDNPSKNMYTDLKNILFKKERQFYVGIIFIILSFVIYFIDGVTL